MSFLVLLLALWVEKFSALRHQVQRDGFFLGDWYAWSAAARCTPGGRWPSWCWHR